MPNQPILPESDSDVDYAVQGAFFVALGKHEGHKLHTFSFLEHCQDSTDFVDELQRHAAGTELHELDLLYAWTCEWVFAMRTDQQTLEATFNRHTHTHTHTFS